MTAREPDPREARLPRWVQQDLKVLRREAADLRRRLIHGEPKVYDTHLDVPYDAPCVLSGSGVGYQYVVLGEGVHVRFLLEERQWRNAVVDLRVEGNRLHVMGAERLDIRPHVTNVITIGQPEDA